MYTFHGGAGAVIEPFIKGIESQEGPSEIFTLIGCEYCSLACVYTLLALSFMQPDLRAVKFLNLVA